MKEQLLFQSYVSRSHRSKHLLTIILGIILTLFGIESFSQATIFKDWEKFYTGNNVDRVSSIVEVNDGYIIGGSSNSGIGGSKSSAGKGGYDYWVIKIDKNGNKVWDKTFGGSSDEVLTKIIKTSDGNILLAGSSNSDIGGDKTEAARRLQYESPSFDDFWIVKISSTGTKIWDKTLGGPSHDILADIVELPDGNLIIGGSSKSKAGGEKSEDPRSLLDLNQEEDAYDDFWVIKTNSQGIKQWDKTYGGRSIQALYQGKDVLKKIIPTSDGGFLLGGKSNSMKGFEKSADNFFVLDSYHDDDSHFDYWIVRINGNGDKLWDKTLGGFKDENLKDMIATPDQGFIITGSSNSLEGGNKEQYPSFDSQSDYSPSAHNWIVKLAANGNKVWEKVHQVDGQEDNPLDFSYLAGDSQGFYVVNDYSISSNFVRYILNFDWAGNEISNKVLDAGINSRLHAFKQLSSGGLLLGYWFTHVDNDFLDDFRLVKYSSPVDSSRIEVEKNFVKITDPGSNPIGVFNSSTLSAGSSTKLYDVGDKIRINFSVTETGPYRIMVRLRSGYHNSATSYNKTSYWPNGYRFAINGSLNEFKGDLASVSGHSTAYGGSYWGTMSAIKTLNAGSNYLDIESLKQWAGVDYIEIVKLQVEEIYRAINFNGPALSIDNVNFESSSTARNFIFRSGRTYNNQSITLNPSASAEKATMIRSSFYSTKTQPMLVEINSIPVATYNLYLYTWEDNFTQNFRLRIEAGAEGSAGQVNSGSAGQWKRLGPYRIDILNGDLTIETSEGDGNISGIELWKVNDDHVTTGGLTLLSSVQNPDNNSLKAYPNPIQSQINIELPEEINGEANFMLLDAYGKVYLNKKHNLNKQKQLTLDLPVNSLKTGIYSLKVNSKGFEKVIRLNKE